jgi:hypothetical protein
MFGLFSSTKFFDPQLGEFQRSRGHWRGLISFEGDENIPLVVCGNRKAPDTEALQSALQLSSQFSNWKTIIGQALFEHYTPYAEAIKAGELPLPDQVFPIIACQDQVWPHVTLEFVAILPLENKITIEFGYSTDWDEEHTLGARFQSRQFLELCGSVLPA